MTDKQEDDIPTTTLSMQVNKKYLNKEYWDEHAQAEYVECMRTSGEWRYDERGAEEVKSDEENSNLLQSRIKWLVSILSEESYEHITQVLCAFWRFWVSCGRVYFAFA